QQPNHRTCCRRKTKQQPDPCACCYRKAGEQPSSRAHCYRKTGQQPDPRANCPRNKTPCMVGCVADCRRCGAGWRFRDAQKETPQINSA
uniref:hypothetical protein n=1 Tax=Gemmiger formicilis TaxID=745368 RepID=UPI003CCA7637